MDESQPSKVCFLYLDQGLLLTRNKASQKGTDPVYTKPGPYSANTLCRHSLNTVYFLSETKISFPLWWVYLEQDI